MSNELFIGMVCAVLSVGLAVMSATKFFSVQGSEDEDVENCGLRDTAELVWQSSLESQKLTEKWKLDYRLHTDYFPRWGGNEVTVTSNRCNYCGTKNEQNHGTCCKCGAPL